MQIQLTKYIVHTHIHMFVCIIINSEKPNFCMACTSSSRMWLSLLLLLLLLTVKTTFLCVFAQSEITRESVKLFITLIDVVFANILHLHTHRSISAWMCVSTNISAGRGGVFFSILFDCLLSLSTVVPSLCTPCLNECIQECIHMLISIWVERVEHDADVVVAVFIVALLSNLNDICASISVFISTLITLLPVVTLSLCYLSSCHSLARTSRLIA